MNDDPRSDSLIRQLSDLPPRDPGASRTARVVSRCHAAMARQVRARARVRRVRSAAANTVDVVFAAAVAFYAAAAVTEAVRLTLLR